MVDLRGADLREEWDAQTLDEVVIETPLARFVERPEFSADLLKSLTDSATAQAERITESIKAGAETVAREKLSADLSRLVDLRKLNDSVRSDEITLAKRQLKQTCAAIRDARLRLDSVRLVLAGIE